MIVIFSAEPAVANPAGFDVPITPITPITPPIPLIPLTSLTSLCYQTEPSLKPSSVYTLPSLLSVTFVSCLKLFYHPPQIALSFIHGIWYDMH